MKDIVKNNSQTILLCIIGFLVVYNIFTTNGFRADIKGYQKNIELIQTKIDSSQAENKKIGVKIDSINGKVVSITNEIHQIDNTITIIKKQTNEKTNSVNNFSNAELEFFFTNRYNKSISPE